MRRHWALCLVGAWIAGSLIMTMVATQNFRTVDRLLVESQNTAFRSVAGELGATRTRDVMRYLSSELNRLYFRWWNLAQLVLGAAVLWLSAGRPDMRRVRILVRAMVAIVAG